MEEIVYKPIGLIHTPFNDLSTVPMQSVKARNIDGYIEIYPEYAEGLKDLEGFSHLIILFHMHKVKDFSLIVKPEISSKMRGVFSTRSPKRPNPIGLTVVKLIKIEGSIIRIRGVDMLDSTPLLDVKPYIPELDSIPRAKIGWLSNFNFLCFWFFCLRNANL